mmetsp:Transcript_11666/g.20983  ORF Transcript_11666/g.20983 Transcript_11666/m.20983 type:complete len:225 (+) Transcript_11666:534-1208(+)
MTGIVIVQQDGLGVSDMEISRRFGRKSCHDISGSGALQGVHSRYQRFEGGTGVKHNFCGSVGGTIPGHGELGCLLKRRMTGQHTNPSGGTRIVGESIEDLFFDFHRSGPSKCRKESQVGHGKFVPHKVGAGLEGMFKRHGNSLEPLIFLELRQTLRVLHPSVLDGHGSITTSQAVHFRLRRSTIQEVTGHGQITHNSARPVFQAKQGMADAWFQVDGQVEVCIR